MLYDYWSGRCLVLWKFLANIKALICVLFGANLAAHSRLQTLQLSCSCANLSHYYNQRKWKCRSTATTAKHIKHFSFWQRQQVFQFDLIKNRFGHFNEKRWERLYCICICLKTFYIFVQRRKMDGLLKPCYPGGWICRLSNWWPWNCLSSNKTTETLFSKTWRAFFFRNHR